MPQLKTSSSHKAKVQSISEEEEKGKPKENPKEKGKEKDHRRKKSQTLSKKKKYSTRRVLHSTPQNEQDDQAEINHEKREEDMSPSFLTIPKLKYKLQQWDVDLSSLPKKFGKTRLKREDWVQAYRETRQAKQT